MSGINIDCEPGAFMRQVSPHTLASSKTVGPRLDDLVPVVVEAVRFIRMQHESGRLTWAEHQLAAEVLRRYEHWRAA